MNKTNNRKNKILADLSAQNRSVITTSDIEEAGIYRSEIPDFIDEGLLVREAPGVYSVATEFPDEFLILQKRSNKIIYSYTTALFFWHLTDRIPDILDVTVPQGYNTSRIKRRNDHVQFHYVSSALWKVGITQTETPFGNSVRLYDKERCIIDLIAHHNQIDPQVFVPAVRQYMSINADLATLIKYAKLFHIEDKVRNYIEILV